MELETWQAPPGDTIPNHPGFPVLVYRGTGMRDPMTARSRFAEHGWGGSWVDGVFDYHHFHSTSHEVLAVVAGRATLELGGPQGETFEVAAGDVVVLPAGTGHRRAGADGSFTVVGAYPAGQEDYDLLRGDDPAEVADARERIAALGAPPQDPVGGEGVDGWRQVARR
ncbi:MAG: cupin domain-containing protein [Solirubrobacteraceae bacterium]